MPAPRRGRPTVCEIRRPRGLQPKWSPKRARPTSCAIAARDLSDPSPKRSRPTNRVARASKRSHAFPARPLVQTLFGKQHTLKKSDAFISKNWHRYRKQLLFEKNPDSTHEPESDCAFQDDTEYPNIGSKWNQNSKKTNTTITMRPVNFRR